MSFFNIIFTGIKFSFEYFEKYIIRIIYVLFLYTNMLIEKFRKNLINNATK